MDGQASGFFTLRCVSLSPAALATRALERAGQPASLLVDESAGGEVRADATLLLRALANLLDNAYKHAGGGGFSVGNRLFQPFAGGGGETSSLGLGLALVRRIAQAHGGSAYAENLPEGGARVGFEISAR